MDIVMVKFQSKHHAEEFSGREYSYLAAIPVSEGDIVTVPTRYGSTSAMITKVGVLDSELGFDKSKLKTIEAPVQTQDPLESVPTF